VKQNNSRWLKLFLLCYAVGGIILFYTQDKLLFHPEPVAAYHVYDFPKPYEEQFITYDSTTQFHLVKFPASTDSTKGVVLYFHGNRKNIGHYAKYTQLFTKHGYSVWMCDYPGFGKSTGQRTEAILYDEAEQVYKLARQQYDKQQIVIYGKSLGTGIASYLASKRDCKQLFLETPYYSITSLARQFAFIYPVGQLMAYKIPQAEYLKKVTAPITIVHGTNDWTTFYSNALRLKKSFKPGDQFITIRGGKHNGLTDSLQVQQAIQKALQ
jgi:alpha-beta hydrolase superfamily lysophospholipase